MNRALLGWLLAGSALSLLLMTPSTAVPARWALVNGLHPQVQARFLALLHAIERHTGGQVVLTSGHRPNERSYHYFGLALDLNVVIGGRWYRMATPKPEWEATGVPALIRAAGFRWGGDFRTTPYDPVHIDLGNTYNLSTLWTRALGLADGRRVSLS